MYKKSHDVYLKKINNEIWVIKDGNKIYNMNETGTLFMKYLLKGYGVKEIKDKLKLRYDIDEHVLDKDINNLLKQLEKEKILIKAP